LSEFEVSGLVGECEGPVTKGKSKIILAHPVWDLRLLEDQTTYIHLHVPCIGHL